MLPDVDDQAFMKNGSSYQDANVTRRNIASSAHSRCGAGSDLPHGVVIRNVVWLSSEVVATSESTHAAYFSSQVRPLFAGHAMPASVLTSYQRRDAVHTLV